MLGLRTVFRGRNSVTLCGKFSGYVARARERLKVKGRG